MRRMLGITLIALFWLSLGTAPMSAIEPASPVRGALVIVGGGRLPDAVRDRFIELGGGKQAKLVVIPTASDQADSPQAAKTLDFWKPTGVEPALLHSRSRETADSEAFVKPLLAATAVWFDGGDQTKITDAYLGTRTERELHAVLDRGGVIGGTSAGAAIMSRTMIRNGNPRAHVGLGFDFLPGAVIDQHFLARNRFNRLCGVLRDHPGLVGFGVDEATALVVRGREMTVLGDSFVTVCLAPSADRPARFEVLKSGDRTDLTMLSRAAIARSQPTYPPREFPLCEVRRGTLVIVGGGGTPPEALQRFIAASGGADGRIVVIPNALGDAPPFDDGEVKMLARAGAKNVKMVFAPSRKEAGEAKFLDEIRAARGVWFSGGRQWRFVDAYLDTPAVKEFHAVLDRGGAIGGSSAGATIQGDYLVRGSPLGNLEMMVEGYERGLAFLPGAAIDQHFSQRNRFADMTALKAAFPQVLGFGIDESTALIVAGTTLEVVGRNQAAIYDQSPRPAGNSEQPEKDYRVLKPGEKYDLKSRQPIPAKQAK